MFRFTGKILHIITLNRGGILMLDVHLTIYMLGQISTSVFKFSLCSMCSTVSHVYIFIHGYIRGNFFSAPSPMVNLERLAGGPTLGLLVRSPVTGEGAH